MPVGGGGCGGHVIANERQIVVFDESIANPTDLNMIDNWLPNHKKPNKWKDHNYSLASTRHVIRRSG